MKITLEKRRLKEIKLKFFFFPRECACCKCHVKLERMWAVWRYGVNKTCHQWFYCQDCMKTAEDVLNEIDTDSCMFGIAGVDSYMGFKKKDNTKMMKSRPKFPDPNGEKQ